MRIVLLCTPLVAVNVPLVYSGYEAIALNKLEKYEANKSVI